MSLYMHVLVFECLKWSPSLPEMSKDTKLCLGPKHVDFKVSSSRKARHLKNPKVKTMLWVCMCVSPQMFTEMGSLSLITWHLKLYLQWNLCFPSGLKCVHIWAGVCGCRQQVYLGSEVLGRHIIPKEGFAWVQTFSNKTPSKQKTARLNTVKKELKYQFTWFLVFGFVGQHINVN